MTVLIDTSFLVALASSKDPNHKAALQQAEQLTSTAIVSAPVMPELFYMLVTRLGYPAAIRMFTYLDSEDFIIENLTSSDRKRMREIMIQYTDARFDFVDTSIMALSERLSINTVYTFDHRDFSIFRPRTASRLQIKP